jgi:hypothetical protein
MLDLASRFRERQRYLVRRDFGERPQVFSPVSYVERSRTLHRQLQSFRQRFAEHLTDVRAMGG